MKRVQLIGALLLTAIMAWGEGASPYINKVYEYRPAPGQFINLLPQYESGDTEADMLRKVEALIADTLGSANYICLGGWGGYVIFGFDHTILNMPGQADFEVGGNYFSGRLLPNPYAEKNPTGTFAADTLQAGSSEPGIIYVARDENGNGLPDDPWYEIAGSEYPYTRTDYSITYYRPADSTAHVVGLDADGDSVFVYHNAFHRQAYYPHWMQADSYTLSGSLLPHNILEGTMNLITLQYGYADNAKNGTDANGIDIDWAVDAMGNAVHLTGIDFVKVQTGVSQDGQAMGETSTEVTGARDLHPLATALATPSVSATAEKRIIDGQLRIIRNGHIYTSQGHLLH